MKTNIRRQAAEVELGQRDLDTMRQVLTVRISEATAAKPTERVCRWIMSANGYTTTECGYIVQSNERRACPYCGGKIIEEVRT